MALFRSLVRQFGALSVARPLATQMPHFRTTAPVSCAPLLFVSTLAMRTGMCFPQLQARAMGYKLKTKSAVKKRFKVNRNGLVKRAQANKRHIATKKTRERIRRLGKPVFVQGKIRKNILRMLGKK